MAQGSPRRPGARSRLALPRPSPGFEALPEAGGEDGCAEEPAEVAMTSNTQKCDENRNRNNKEMENEASENPPQLSSLDKPDLAFPEDSQSLYEPEPLEKLLEETNKEIMNLLSKYAHLLSESAAMDASYIQELDGILKEAKAIENHLKQRRESLKHKLTVIANTLQS